MTDHKLKIGLVINPIAGIGGPAGLKGSDGVVAEALAKGSVSRVVERMLVCLKALDLASVQFFCMPGAMGAAVLEQAGIVHKTLGSLGTESTTSADTKHGVSLLEAEHIDLLLFAGGDGTARDIVDAHQSSPAVLGVPCGVKMHSGVFATSPSAAAELINKLAQGKILSVVQGEVRDIDEASFRDGIVKTKFYGELPIAHDLQYMQQTKIGGQEVDELVMEEIAADFIENLLQDVTYIMGSGSTIAYLMQAMSLETTLLGIDVVRNQRLVASDVSEQELLKLLDESARTIIVLTAIGHQGHVLGRGNQQISPAVILKVGVGNIVLVVTKSKLNSLEGRPLLVDTGNVELDSELSGLKSVITGYEDRVLYRVA